MSAPPRTVAAIFTVLLHLLVLYALVRVTADAARPLPAPAHEVSADRLWGAGEQVVEVDIRPGIAATGGLACAGSSYVGVGVTADPRTERIILVGDDTPASRAGLLHDDIVLNPEVWRQPLREGMLLRVLVLRDRMKLVVTVRVGTICIG